MEEPEPLAESVECGNEEHDADTNTNGNVDNTDALSVVSSRSSRVVVLKLGVGTPSGVAK